MQENRDELPPDVKHFAPWTWKPWKRWALVVIGLVAYLLTAAPTEYLVNRLNSPLWIHTVRRISFEPAYLILRNSSLAMKVFVWELTSMDALFGETEVTRFYSGQFDSEEE